MMQMGKLFMAVEMKKNSEGLTIAEGCNDQLQIFFLKTIAFYFFHETLSHGQSGPVFTRFCP